MTQNREEKGRLEYHRIGELGLDVCDLQLVHGDRHEILWHPELLTRGGGGRCDERCSILFEVVGNPEILPRHRDEAKLGVVKVVRARNDVGDGGQEHARFVHLDIVKIVYGQRQIKAYGVRWVTFDNGLFPVNAGRGELRGDGRVLEGMLWFVCWLAIDLDDHFETDSARGRSFRTRR